MQEHGSSDGSTKRHGRIDKGQNYMNIKSKNYTKKCRPDRAKPEHTDGGLKENLMRGHGSTCKNRGAETRRKYLRMEV
jgi:hypothetical protein